MSNDDREKIIITPIGTVTCLDKPPGGLPACDGNGSWRNGKCKNRARYRINNVNLCLRHAQCWAFITAVGPDNIVDTTPPTFKEQYRTMEEQYGGR